MGHALRNAPNTVLMPHMGYGVKETWDGFYPQMIENALAFLKQYGITYPSLRDGTDASKRDLEATGVPETFIIDKQGRIALHITGQVTDIRQISVPLDQVLAEK